MVRHEFLDGNYKKQRTVFADGTEVTCRSRGGNLSDSSELKQSQYAAKGSEIMKDMNGYYDFSGQKFGYPLSLSINGFSQMFYKAEHVWNFLCALRRI